MYAKGLWTDGLPLNQPEGTYRHAENASLRRQEGSVSSREGTSVVGALPTSHIAIGSVVLTDDVNILFLVNPSTGHSEIGSFTTIGGYDKILEDGGTVEEVLSFNKDYPIQATSKINSKGERVIYWVDGLNPPRRLNIDIISSTSIENKELNIFPQIDQCPTFDFIRVNNTGGILKTGSYHVALALITEEGDQTPYLIVSNPISIQDEALNQPIVTDGAPASTGSTKSISVSVQDIDIRFPYIQPVLIRGTEVKVFPKVAVVEGSTTSFVITGAEASIDGNISEVLINKAIYKTAKALTQQDGVLYLGNLTREEEIGFQKYANNIQVELITEDIDIITYQGVHYAWNKYSGHANDMRDPVIAFKRGFKRNEVYAFYISLLFKDGTESPAYHIPGREPIYGEELTPDDDGVEFYNETNGTDVGATHAFQVETQHGFNGMGYWHNINETYLTEEQDLHNDFQIWDVDEDGEGFHTGDSLWGLPVRHHHFPDAYLEPAYAAGELTQAKTLGIRLNNVKFPTAIKDKIVGYKVHYAKRTVQNARWLDQSPLFRTTFDDEVEDTYRVKHYSDDGHSVSSPEKFQFVYPFTLLRTKTNVDLISYIHSVLLSKRQEYSTTGGNPFVFTPGVYGRYYGYMRPILWAGYVDMNTNPYIGTDSSPLLNTYAPEGLCLEVDDPWTWNYDIVDIMAFKQDMYFPFYNQQLVFTGYVGSVDDETSDNIFGGDTFITYCSHILTTPIDGGDSGKRMIHQVVLESPDNIGLRHEGEGRFETYYPKGGNNRLTHGDYFSEVGDAEPLEATNFIGYNEEYSNVNIIKPAFPFNPYETTIRKFPTRIIRSQKESFVSLADPFRTFLENDFLDVTTQKGPIVKLTGFQGILLIHTKKSLFQTVGREELNTGDIRAYVGSGDIFARPPKEIFSVDEGYAGILDPRNAVLTPSGYFFVDQVAGKIFRLSDGLEDISSTGMRKFFKNNLELTNDGIHLIGYDPYDHRVQITKNDGLAPGETWTISYLPDLKVWESFHGGYPDFYFWNTKHLFGTQLGAVHVYADANAFYKEGFYYSSAYPFIFEHVDNQDPTIDKVVHSVAIDCVFLEESGVQDWREMFDTVRVYSDLQDTGNKEIVYFTTPGGNARKTQNVWKINGLRDQIAASTLGGILPATYRRLINKYHLVRLSYTNAGAKVVQINAIQLLTQPSFR